MWGRGEVEQLLLWEATDKKKYLWHFIWCFIIWEKMASIHHPQLNGALVTTAAIVCDVFQTIPFNSLFIKEQSLLLQLNEFYH